MRIPAVLSADELPEPELITAVLDGELQRLGGAYCPVDTVIDEFHRACCVAAQSPAYTIAEQHTAAWIYGIELELQQPLQLCVDASRKVHPISTRMLAFREVVISPRDVRVFGNRAVTAPLRTAVDLARFSAQFAARDEEIVRQLAQYGRFDLEACHSAIYGRRNLPGKRLALHRLERALRER
jgi:hypothetical protein